MEGKLKKWEQEVDSNLSGVITLAGEPTAVCQGVQVRQDRDFKTLHPTFRMEMASD